MSEASMQLRQAAIEIANGFRHRKLALEEERSGLKLSLAQIKVSLEATDHAIYRLSNFSMTLGGEYQCPRCWIAEGIPSPLIPQPSGNDVDRFKCRVCDTELSL